MLHLPDKKRSTTSRRQRIDGAKRGKDAGDNTRPIRAAGSRRGGSDGDQRGEGRADHRAEELVGHFAGHERGGGEGTTAEQGQGDAQGAGVDTWGFGEWVHPARRAKMTAADIAGIRAMNEFHDIR